MGFYFRYSEIIGIDLGTTNSCVAVMEGAVRGKFALFKFYFWYFGLYMYISLRYIVVLNSCKNLPVTLFQHPGMFKLESQYSPFIYFLLIHEYFIVFREISYK